MALSKPIDTETAWQRAKRDFRHAVGSPYFIGWFVTCEAVITGASIYWSNSASHSAKAQTLVGVGALVAAAVVALGSGFVAIWASAPIRQRNEARTQLSELLAPRQFPDIAIETTVFHQSREDRDGKVGGERDDLRITVPVLVTNQETDHRVSLNFDLIILRDDGESRIPSDQRLEMPVVIDAMDTKRVTLSFFVSWPYVEGVADERMVGGHPHVTIPAHRLRLGFRDHVTGQRDTMDIPGLYGVQF